MKIGKVVILRKKLPFKCAECLKKLSGRIFVPIQIEGTHDWWICFKCYLKWY